MRILGRAAQLFFSSVLKAEGVDDYSTDAVSEGLIHASLRGVDSHGIRLFKHYYSALTGGRINRCPDFSFSDVTATTATLDADHGFGHAAGLKAVEKVVELAGQAGMGAVAVRQSTHFGAASFYGLKIAANNMIGFSFTHSDPLIAPTGAKKAFLGNNPICFAAPCAGEDPVCLDMATSTITFNEVLRLRNEGKKAPLDAGFDHEGKGTRNPDDIVTLSPVGGYKGYGLSLMVEVLCALLSGAPFGPNVGHMYNDPLDKKRNLGQFFIAINIQNFLDIDAFKTRLSELVGELRQQERVNLDNPVCVAGDPEKEMTRERHKMGIPVSLDDEEFFQSLAEQYDVPLEIMH